MNLRIVRNFKYIFNLVNIVFVTISQAFKLVGAKNITAI